MFKVTYKDTRRRSGVFIVNFKHISHFALVFIVKFEQVNAGWVDLLNISEIQGLSVVLRAY